MFGTQMTARTPASTTASAFVCPHCGAFTSQTWFDGYGKARGGENRLPLLNLSGDLEGALEGVQDPQKRQAIERLIRWDARMRLGQLFPDRTGHEQVTEFHNLFLSQCYHCDGISVWVRDKLVFPPAREGVAPSPYLPDDVRIDFDEARTVLTLSPRSSSALLRLALQKLCVALGQKGRNIDADITALVSKGLDPMIQVALDSIRVIGNESVHPGQMDMKDDVATAGELFVVINFIAEQLIGTPKKLREIYSKLPQDKRDAIDARNAKALQQNP